MSEASSMRWSTRGTFGRVHAVLRRPGLVRNAAVLAGGTVGGQLITVCTLPVITRIYDPADMGYYGLLLSFIYLASVASSLKFETAIMTPVDAREATTLTWIAILVSVPMSVVLASILYGLISFSVFGFGILRPSTVLWALAALILTAALGALRYRLLRSEEYGSITQVTMYQNAARVATQIVTGLLGMDWIGLVIGDVGGRAAGLRILLRPVASELRTALRQLTPSDLAKTIYTYRRFPLLSLPSSLIDTAVVTLTLPLVARYFGVEVAGFFALAQRVLAMPAMLVGQSVADAFHAKLSVTVRTEPERTRTVFLRTAGLTTILAAPVTLGLMLVGQPLFGAVFGHRWLPAGAIAVALAPAMLAQMIVSPLSRAVFVLSGQATKLIYDAISLILLVGVMAGAVHQHLTIVATVWWLSGVRVVSYAVYFLILERLVSEGRANMPA